MIDLAKAAPVDSFRLLEVRARIVNAMRSLWPESPELALVQYDVPTQGPVRTTCRTPRSCWTRRVELAVRVAARAASNGFSMK